MTLGRHLLPGQLEWDHYLKNKTTDFKTPFQLKTHWALEISLRSPRPILTFYLQVNRKWDHISRTKQQIKKIHVEHSHLMYIVSFSWFVYYELSSKFLQVNTILNPLLKGGNGILVGTMDTHTKIIVWTVPTETLWYYSGEFMIMK